MDEWSQFATTRPVMDYSRRYFPRKTQRQKFIDKKSFTRTRRTKEINTGEEVLVIDPDFKLFLKGCKALLQSRIQL